MQFPNKLYSYKNSALALIPTVLNEIKEETGSSEGALRKGEAFAG